MKRGYQHRYSTTGRSLYDVEARERKARTMVAVLQELFDAPLASLDLLNVGGSTGIMDNYLAGHFRAVTGIDIDDTAIAHATRTYRRSNLAFHVADALDLPFSGRTFDVAVCSQVYEHVADAHKLFDEIHRVLKPGGVCYFTANNRLMLIEPHYHLPFLSVMPRCCAHRYLRLTRRGDYYYERHATWWGLKSLAKRFELIDYSLQTVSDPAKYHVEYMVSPGSVKLAAARFILRYLPWASPSYIWVLRRPQESGSGSQER